MHVFWQLLTIPYSPKHIHPSTHVMNMGVYFDRYMFFDVHITELTKEIMGTIIYKPNN